MAYLYFTIHTDGLDALKDKLSEAASKAEETVAQQVLADTDPYVPMREGILSGSGRTQGRFVIYGGPAAPGARYIYRGVVWVDPVTKAAGFLTKDGWKSRKNVTKVETQRKLNISKSEHPLAQSRWFEASKAQNLDKWVEIAEKAVGKNVK